MESFVIYSVLIDSLLRDPANAAAVSSPAMRTLIKVGSEMLSQTDPNVDKENIIRNLEVGMAMVVAQYAKTGSLDPAMEAAGKSPAMSTLLKVAGESLARDDPAVDKASVVNNLIAGVDTIVGMHSKAPSV